MSYKTGIAYNDVIVIVSGGFDPLHEGHLSLFNEARKLGSDLVVILNSTEWLIKKKGKAFMSWDTRAEIIKNLKPVTLVVPVDDEDGTVIKGLEHLRTRFSNNKLIFANGGDRNKNTTPEVDFCEKHNIQLAWDVCKVDKINSSSKLLKQHKEDITYRPWGHFKTLESNKNYKIKELHINPHSSISLQYHNYRAEHWVIVDGTAEILLNGLKFTLTAGSGIYVPEKAEHKISNIATKPLVIVETQIGSYIGEDDIIRLS